MKFDFSSYDKFKIIHEIRHEHGFLLWRYGTEDNVEIVDMKVDVKRKGYGTKLIATLLHALEKNPPSVIFLFTKKDNLKARAFYEVIGFEKCGFMGSNVLYGQYYEQIESLTWRVKIIGKGKKIFKNE